MKESKAEQETSERTVLTEKLETTEFLEFPVYLEPTEARGNPEPLEKLVRLIHQFENYQFVS